MTLHGITVRGYCPNAHIVQFVYRQRISPQSVALPGTVSASSGEYPLTTDLGDIHWHTGVPPIDLAPLAQRNAYVDQAKGAVHSRARLSVTFFDVPNFPEGTYPPAGQVADRQKSEIREIRARAFLVCNCEVKREVWWSKVKQVGIENYTKIRIITAAPDALSWINAHLKADGYEPIP